MHDSGIQRWRVWLGAVASASLVSACGVLPRNGEDYAHLPGEPGGPPVGQELAGYNRTIKDLPTSIDPRTPETEGTPGRSIPQDLGEAAMGGAGGVREGGVYQEVVPGAGTMPGVGDSATYGGSGAEGAAALPRTGTMINPDPGPPAQAPEKQRGEGQQHSHGQQEKSGKGEQRR